MSRKTHRHRSAHRPLRVEPLEDRRMLAKADIVFLVDESQSGIDAPVRNWLRAMVTGDVNGNGVLTDPGDTLSLAQKLALQGVNDVRYGLVGFGQSAPSISNPNIQGEPRNAHSQLFISGNPSSLTVNPVSPGITTATLNAAFNALRQFGGIEDGWDAIEHAIAEYPIRDGAAPVFVLIQNEEGRAELNQSLTRDGVWAALRSKNVILHSLVVGPNKSGPDPVRENNPTEPLFDLAPYGLHADLRVLGAQADVAANDPLPDGRHNFFSIDVNAANGVQTPAATNSQAMQASYNGSSTGAIGLVGTGKSLLLGTKLSDGLGTPPGTANGYRAKSVPYQFTSLVNPTTGLPVAGATKLTNLSSSVALPFGFSYFGVNRTSAFVNEDGTISFGAALATGENVDLTRAVAGQTRPTIPLIAALWDELNVDSSSSASGAFVKTDGVGTPDHRWTVQWNRMVYSGDSGALDPIAFQAVLYADGRIQFNYQDLDARVAGPFQQPSPTLNSTGGLSATVGLWKGSAESIAVSAGAIAPGLHSLNGSRLDFDFSAGGDLRDTNDSYVRLAWDTGGSAWDAGVIEEFGAASAPANALRDNFVTNLGQQIVRAELAGKLFRTDQVVLAINLGGGALDLDGVPGINVNAGDFSADPVAPTSANSLPLAGVTVGGVDARSNSIPTANNTNAKPADLFKTARTADRSNSVGEDLKFNFDALADGTYVVELFFAEIGVGPGGFQIPQRKFDVVFEGNESNGVNGVQALNDYEIRSDQARIIDLSGNELDVTTLGDNFFSPSVGGTVKRFEVDVTASAGAGLQIELRAETNDDPILNGIRVLRSDAPRVKDVAVKGTTWAPGVDYSLGIAAGRGEQLKPVYRSGVNVIQIQFDSPVRFASGPTPGVPDGRELKIYKTRQAGVELVSVAGFSYDPVNRLAAWTLSQPLADDKYAIRLNASVAGGGTLLDGDWSNPDNGTFDKFDDDLKVAFPSGDGFSGSDGNEFRFHFSVLKGDYDQNGAVTAADQLVVKDGDGDGVVETGYHPPGNTPNDDLALATSVGRYLPFSKRRGDLNDDEVSNVFDWRIFIEALDTAPGHPKWDPRADTDDDLDVDIHDFDNFKTAYLQFNSSSSANRSAWYEAFAFAAAMAPVGAAPRVWDVIISGSTSAHAPFAFSNVDGSGSQLATVPVGAADTISIVFSESVNVSADSLFLVGLTDATRPTLAAFAYDDAARTATWRFTGWSLYGDNYLISLSDQVTDAEGNPLDGDWTNPSSITTANSMVSEFPSGDGVAGGQFNFVMTLLPGDANLDGIVNAADEAILWANWGSADVFVEGDFNGNGYSSDTGDWIQLNRNWLLNLTQLGALADLDGDFDVDENDVAVIDYHFGMTAGATRAHGDLDGDGDVDMNDLSLAFAQFGLSLSVVG